MATSNSEGPARQRRPMTHAARKERRKRIAAFAKEHPNLTVRQLARKFKVSVAIAKAACDESGVVPSAEKRTATSCYVVLAKLLAGGHQASIARELGVHRQYVHIVKQLGIKAGIVFPNESAQ